MGALQSFVYLTSGAPVVLLSGELNSLANNNLAPGLVPINNASGYPLAEFEFRGPVQSYGPSGGIGALSLWLLRAVVSGTYEDGTSGYTPSRIPNVKFPVQSGTVAVTIGPFTIPPGWFTPLFKNDGTGLTMASSGNVVRMNQVAYQIASG